MPDEQVQQGNLSCQEVVELVTDYLEHALLSSTRTLLENHLTGCDGCATYLDQVRKTITMLHMLAQGEVFPGTKQELLEIFRSWKQAS